jgi:hypothetical protein
VATHILAFKSDGKAPWFECNYQACREQRRRLLGDAADRPRRVQFRPVGKCRVGLQQNIAHCGRGGSTE